MPQSSNSPTEPSAADASEPSAGNATLLLTVPEACQLLRVSRWSLCQLIQRRELRTIKIGSRRLVPRTAIEDFIRQRAEEAYS